MTSKSLGWSMGTHAWPPYGERQIDEPGRRVLSVYPSHPLYPDDFRSSRKTGKPGTQPRRNETKKENESVNRCCHGGSGHSENQLLELFLGNDRNASWRRDSDQVNLLAGG